VFVKAQAVLAPRVTRSAVTALAVLAGMVGVTQLGTARAGSANAVAPAAEPQSLFPEPNQFLYVRSKGAFMNCRMKKATTCRLGPRRVREVWLSERRDGLLIERPSTLGRSRVGLKRTRLYLGNRLFAHSALATYAPTGAQLLAELQSGRVPGQGNGGASYPFVELTDALREAAMPVSVRRAIVEALALVPGVTQLGKQDDSLGRPGVAFSRTLADSREEVIVDPVALVMLEERTFLLNQSAAPGAGKKPGDQIGGAVYLKRAVVSRAGLRP